MSRYINIGSELADQARRYGEGLAAWYASAEGAASASRSRSGQWGAERDPIRLGQSKAGEYAVALLFKLDPQIAVDSNIARADAGRDVTITGIGIDVKTTPRAKRYLVWSQAVNDLYWQKDFSTLVGVSIDDLDWEHCWIDGWMSKEEFFEHKLIADGINDEGRLTPGTWFIPKSALHYIDTLIIEPQTPRGNPFFGHCACGAPGLYAQHLDYMPTAEVVWFCNKHRVW